MRRGCSQGPGLFRGAGGGGLSVSFPDPAALGGGDPSGPVSALLAWLWGRVGTV